MSSKEKESPTAIESIKDDHSKDDDDDDDEKSSHNKDTPHSLIDDHYFDKRSIDFNEVIEKVKINTKHKNEGFKSEHSSDLNDIIETNSAQYILKDMIDSIEFNIPILLISSDNAFKIINPDIFFKDLNLKLIKLDMSPDITVQDLIGRYYENKNSWPGISMRDGPLLEAFKEGRVLLLNNIDKAHLSVLNFLEKVLDDEVLNLNLVGRPYEEIKMDKKFHLIISRGEDYHPLSSSFIEALKHFEKRFKKIQLPNITRDDLQKASLDRANKYNYKNNEVVNELVNFHESLKSTFPIEQYQFSFREIDDTLYALGQEEDIHDTIISIYGARFLKKDQDQFQNILNNFPNLKRSSGKEIDLPKFPQCYNTKSLATATKSLIFSLKNQQNVLLVGEDGCGKTQLALWASENYNNEIKIPNENVSFIFNCTKDSKIADLVGGTSLFGQKSKNSDLDIWQPGFLPNHIKQGSCCILDNIDQAPNYLPARINSLLDSNYDDENHYFEIPESTSFPKVLIHKNFRIIATCNINGLKSLDPTIRNKFNIIILENQIENISENDYKNLIKTMLDRYRLNWIEEDEGRKTQLTNKLKRKEKFEYPEEIIQLLFEKVSKLIDISLISRICKSVIYLYFFLRNDEINENEIIDLALNLHTNDKDLSNNIKEKLYTKLNNEIEKENLFSFFYTEIPELKDFFAKLMAYSVIQQPVFIIGQPGIGKKSALRTFSLMRPNKSSSNQITFQLHSFNEKTKSSDFFGNSTFYQGEIQYNDGPLISSVKQGLVCIANDLNLANENVIDSLSIILDPTIYRKNIFVPNNNHFITISPDFFFACCITDKIDLNSIPDRIKKQFIQINYPQILNGNEICKEIIKYNLPDYLKDTFDDKENKIAEDVFSFMNCLNQLKLNNIYHWSFNNVNKLFKRIYKDENRFVDMSPYQQIIFYTLSSVLPSDVDNVKACILDALKSKLDEEELKALFECYDAEPRIESDPILYFMKKDSGVSFDNVEFSEEFYNKLPTFREILFEFQLLDVSESVLFISDSEFDTFIGYDFYSTVEKLSNLDPDYKTDSCLLLFDEAKFLYTEFLSKIMDLLINNKDENEIGFNRLYFVINTLSTILLNHDSKTISNFVLEFNPKLFLSILSKQLKFDIPTSINDNFISFINNKVSPLDEPSFDDEDKNLIDEINNIFRIFASCSSISLSNLSDEIKSNFTFIFVSEYTKQEQEEIIKAKIKDEKYKFNPNNVSKLNDFGDEYQKTIKKTFTLSEKLKVIEFSSSIQKDLLFYDDDDGEEKDDTEKEQIKNLGIILYRYLCGKMDSNEQIKQLIELLNDEFDLPEIYEKINNHEDCDDLIKVNEGNSIKSEMSNLSIESVFDIHEPGIKVAFTPSFNDLLDLIHLSLLIQTPLILTGSVGQGKHTAIQYLAKSLNIEVIPITILSSTKIEDLFGRDLSTKDEDEDDADLTETQFVQLIKNGSYAKKVLIIIEMMNNASFEVLNALIPVFDSNVTEIFLPNGNRITKGQFNIIGICNTQQNKNEFPQKLINSALNYTVLNPNPNEIEKIIDVKIDGAENFKEDFCKINTNSPKPIPLDEIEKYRSFCEIEDNFLDESTIEQMILAYRSSNSKEIIESLDLEPMNFNPIFNYDSPPTKLFITSKSTTTFEEDLSKNKTIPLDSNPDNSSIISKINTLSLQQKHALIFLIFSYLSKRSCVLQGPKSSEKTKIIRLFSKLLGKKLVVYQMTPETNLSILTGKSTLNEDLSDQNQNDLIQALNDLRTVDGINDYIKNPENKINDPSKLKPQPIRNLLKFIIKDNKYLMDGPDSNIINESIQTIKKVINPLNRFDHQDSEFIKAIQEGGLILLDGIELAPSEIAEFISSLCSENPEINIFQNNSAYHFMSNSEDPEILKIHEDFRLFITYNTDTKNINKIDETFLMKSPTFSLSLIEGKIIDSSQILFGEFIDRHYPVELSKKLASHLASLHNEIKEGNLFVSPYIINYEMKIFDSFGEIDSSDLITKSIDLIFHLLYCNITEKEDELYKKCINEFTKELDPKLENNLDRSYIDEIHKNETYIIQLLSIQENIKKLIIHTNEENNYSFELLFNTFLEIQISDISYVQRYIKETLKMINRYDDKESKLIVKYGLLYSIYYLFNDILQMEEFKEKDNLSLSLKEAIFRGDDKTNSPILKFDLLNKLIEDQFISENSSTILTKDKCYELINQIVKILSNGDKESVIELFNIIQDDNECIDFIEKIFPYAHFKSLSLSLINYWIPLTKTLIQNNIHLIIKIDEKKFEFNKESDFDIGVVLIMNETANLSLSNGSMFTYENNTIKEEKGFAKDNDKLMYYRINQLAVQKMIPLRVTKSSKSIIQQCYSDGMKEFRIKNDNSLLDNQIISIKDLFEEEDRDQEIINYIWNLIFTSSKQQIQDLIKIINPVESKMLNTALNMYNSISNYNINLIYEWTVWTQLLDKYIDPITKFYFDTVESEYNNDRKFNELYEIANDEMPYLTNSPDVDNIFWDPRDLIKKCKKGLDHLKRLKEEKDRIAKENEIKRKLNEVKKILNKDRIKPKFIKTRNEIFKLINDTTEFSDVNFEHISSAVYEFLGEARNENRNDVDEENKNLIDWPSEKRLNTSKTTDPNELKKREENIKIFELLIKYSKIIEPIKQLEMNNSIISNIVKLSDFEEMTNPAKILLSDFVLNYKEKDYLGLTSNNIKNAEYSLEATLIWKFYNINQQIITEKSYIDKMINKYIKRKMISTPEINWIYQKIYDIPSDFALLIPKFSFNALVFLVVNKSVEKDFQAGPLFSTKTLNAGFYKKEAELMFRTNFTSFCDVAKSIAQIAYSFYIEHEDELPNDYNEMKNLFITKTKTENKIKGIKNEMNTIFLIAESLDKWDQPKLVFDDLFFLSVDFEKISNDGKYINEYPLLVHWLTINYNCSEQLKYFYKNYVGNPDKIEMWIICLRFLSSQNCLKFGVISDSKERSLKPTSHSKHNKPKPGPWIPGPPIYIPEPVKPEPEPEPEEHYDPNYLNYLSFIVDKIKGLNRSDELNINDKMISNNFVFDQNLLNTSYNNFPVNNLIKHVQYFSMILFKGASESNLIPFSSICANLLIDCSEHISNEKKFYNFTILTAFSFTLKCLEIPFTISLVADDNFNFLLKKFDENLTGKVLQSVFECLFIQRNRCIITDTFKYVINELSNPEKSQRSIFFLSDGLCENLVLTEGWKLKILNNKTISFGLIFNDSKVYNKPEFRPIKKMWDKFNNWALIAESKTKLIYVNQDFKQQTVDTILKLFVDTLTRPNSKQDYKSQFDPKPSFVNSYYYDYNKLSNDAFNTIQRYMNIAIDNNNKSPLFKRYNDKFNRNKATTFEPVDTDYYQSKLNTIASSVVDSSIQQSNFTSFVRDKFLKKNSKAVSESFLKVLNKNSRHNLTCNVSIIIDSSTSCFKGKAANHSFKTLSALLSAISSIDLVENKTQIVVNIIITTNEAPIILCIQKSSNDLLKPDSSIWPSLFSVLSNNCPLPNKLDTAIHAAFDIFNIKNIKNTKRSFNDVVNTLFVLSDGLYPNDQKEIIKKHVAACEKNRITVFGIGIGLYPVGMVEMFPRVVFSPDPDELVAKGIINIDDGSELVIQPIMPINETSYFSTDLSNLIPSEGKQLIFIHLKNSLSSKPKEPET